MKAIILDTETTGIKNARPIEIAYFEVGHAGIGILDMSGITCNRYNPMQAIEFGAMATHHITNDDVADCPPYTDFLLDRDVGYLIGHNIDFDWQVIQTCGEQPEPKRICTLAIARHLYPDADSHKLTAMLYQLDMDLAKKHARNAHSAGDDVWMTMLLLNLMLPNIGATSFEELYRFSELARIPTVMSFGKYKGEKLVNIPLDYKQWLLKQPDLDPYLTKVLRSR